MAFTNFDLVALPTMRITPRTINDALNREEEPKPPEPETISNCTPFNIFGLPAISIPCGFSKDGLPIGLMIAGRQVDGNSHAEAALSRRLLAQLGGLQCPLPAGHSKSPIYP